jgi:16S rRNA (cytosine1402-N4)-methyltransferase
MSIPPDDPGPPHRRRPRYRGTHPRTFQERYKELAADQYPDIVPHVLAKGRTPAGQHVPIMVEEILEVLAPSPGERAVDATLGWGGHARRLLERLAPGGQLLGLDADPIELPRTEARLRALGFAGNTFLARRSNFAGLRAALAAAGWNDGADMVLADLGVSSMQIDNPERGFTFAADGPLDMRMNPNRGLSAAAWLERASGQELARALRENADEPHAGLIAEALVARRGAITTTRTLADAVRGAIAGRGRGDDADLSVRRVFQALRIEVNDELGALDALLRDLPHCLRPGGRVAVLTFHSGEDRRVKHAFARGSRDGTYADVAREVTRASASEQHDNPRSRPAKLRWARRPPALDFAPPSQ